MNLYKRKIFFTLLIVLGFSLGLVSAAVAQAETATFTEDFEEINWEEWEHSQDVIVENGVLTINPGNFVLRLGDWTQIDLDITLRFSPPGEVVVNYYLRDEGHYALILTGENSIDRVILEKQTPEGGSLLGEGEVSNFTAGEWNDINIKVEDGSQTISINQQNVISVVDDLPLTTGAVMLHVFGESAAEFDSFSLSGIPTEGMPGAESGAEPSMEEPGGEEPPPSEDQQPEGNMISDTSSDGSTGTENPTSLIKEFLSGQSNQLELSTFLINLVLAVIASFILGRVYIYWGSSLSNRRAFAANFILLTVTTTFIILVVRSSVALSLGLVGALSIVRFRAAVKEPEELAFLFFAISLGIGLGDNQRLITLLTLAVGIIVIALLHYLRQSGADVNLHLTIANRSSQKVSLDQIQQVLDQHCSKVKLLRLDETAQVMETSFVIEFRRVSDLSHAKADLQDLSPEMEISFLDNKGIW